MYKVRFEKLKSVIKAERGRKTTFKNELSMGMVSIAIDKYEFRVNDGDILDLPINIEESHDVDWKTMADIFDDACMRILLNRPATSIQAKVFQNMAKESLDNFVGQRTDFFLKTMEETAVNDVGNFYEEFGEEAELIFPKGVIDLDCVLNWDNIIIHIENSVELGTFKIQKENNKIKTKAKSAADKSFQKIKVSIDRKLKNTPVQKLKRRPRI